MKNFLEEVKYAHDNLNLTWWNAFRLVRDLHKNPIILAEEDDEK